MDAVVELVERGKITICSLNSGSLGLVFRCIETAFGIRQQHRYGGEFKAWVSSL